MLSKSASGARAAAAVAERAQVPHVPLLGHTGPGGPNWSPGACQVPALATGPQQPCSWGPAAQHSAVPRLGFLESRNETGDKYTLRDMGAPAAPEVWELLT